MRLGCWAEIELEALRQNLAWIRYRMSRWSSGRCQDLPAYFRDVKERAASD